MHVNFNYYKDAEQGYKEVLEIYKQLANSKDYHYYEYAADTLEKLKDLHQKMRQNDMAENDMKENLIIYKELCSKDESYNSGLARAYCLMAILHSGQGQNKAAEEEYQEGLIIYRKLSMSNKKSSYFLAITLYNLASIHSESKLYDIAQSEYEEALEIFKGLTPINDDIRISIVKIFNSLSDINIYKNEFERAELCCTESIRYCELINQEHNYYISKSKAQYSNILLKMNRSKDAEKLAKEALKLDKTQTWIYSNLYLAFVMQNDFVKADKCIPKLKSIDWLYDAYFEEWKEFEERGLFTAEQKEYVEKKKKEFEGTKDA